MADKKERTAREVVEGIFDLIEKYNKRKQQNKRNFSNVPTTGEVRYYLVNNNKYESRQLTRMGKQTSYYKIR